VLAALLPIGFTIWLLRKKNTTLDESSFCSMPQPEFPYYTKYTFSMKWIPLIHQLFNLFFSAVLLASLWVTNNLDMPASCCLDCKVHLNNVGIPSCYLALPNLVTFLADVLLIFPTVRILVLPMLIIHIVWYWKIAQPRGNAFKFGFIFWGDIKHSVVKGLSIVDFGAKVVFVLLLAVTLARLCSIAVFPQCQHISCQYEANIVLATRKVDTGLSLTVAIADIIVTIILQTVDYRLRKAKNR